MRYEHAYHCHCSVQLDSGLKIILDRLTQSRTYAGLLEGTPNKKSNDLKIKWNLDRVEESDDSIGTPHLIAPERRDFLREPGDMQSVMDRQSQRLPEMRHIPEWLPQIQCVGVFRSTRPARNPSKDASSLTVVWYQDEFGIDPRAIDRLRAIDWKRLATDWDH